MLADPQSSLFALFDQSALAPAQSGDIVCVGCERKFDRPGSRGKRPTLCGDCRKVKHQSQISEWRKAKKYPANPTTGRQADCSDCGEVFYDPKTKGRARTFCPTCRWKRPRKSESGTSRDRRLALSRTRQARTRQIEISARPTLLCNVCETKLSGPRRKFCSIECNKIYVERVRHGERLKNHGVERWPELACVECDAVFAARPHSNHDRRFCGQTCTTRWHLREKTKRRRARLTTLAVVNFTVDSILERDGWVCQDCGVATPKSARGSGADNEPHMDHIVPLSRGGDHAPSNCRCLCRRCNLDKGALTDPEWRAKKRKREQLAA